MHNVLVIVTDIDYLERLEYNFEKYFISHGRKPTIDITYTLFEVIRRISKLFRFNIF